MSLIFYEATSNFKKRTLYTTHKMIGDLNDVENNLKSGKIDSTKAMQEIKVIETNLTNSFIEVQDDVMRAFQYQNGGRNE